MATNLSDPPAPKVSAPTNENAAKDGEILAERTVPILVRGIIADAKQLIGQQLAMFHQEIRDAVHKNKQAALFLAVGVGVTAAGSGLLLLMLPLLLNWAVPALPLWACFGIIGGVVAVVGGIVLYVGFRKIESFDLLSNKAVEGFKENMTWTTKPT